MCDNIIIGKGEKLCSAIKVFAIEGDHGVSENRSAYWISGCFIDIGMTIFKDSPQGRTLAKFIAKKTPYREIQDWLDNLVLARATPTMLKTKMVHALTDAYDEGSRDRAKTIRESLGITKGW